MNSISRSRQLGAKAVMAALAAWAVAQSLAGAAPATAPLGGPGPADANWPAARAAWKQLAGLDDPAARDKLLPAALEAIGHDPNDVRRLIAADDAYDPIGPGRAERTVQVADAAKKYDVSFTVATPGGYRPDRPWPVLLAAHGQHGDGRSFAHTALRLLGADADKYIIVAPTLPGARQYSGKSYQEQAYLQPLSWVRRHMNVDDDRVYVAGYSLGGHTAWHLATMFPRQFAAAVAMAGTPWFEGAPHTANMYLGNLGPLAFWSIWGELDRPAAPAIGQVQFNRAAAARLNDLNNTRFRATELPGVGHDGCYPGPREFAAFLAGAKRQPIPAKFSHVFHLQHHTRSYYLEAVSLASQPMRMDQPIRVSFDHKPTPEESDRKMEDYFRRFLFSFSAELDRQANSLTITLKGVRTVRLHVMDGMFDLTRPITLHVGTRTWKGLVPPSAQCMLKHYADDRDASAIIVNEVDLDSAGRAVIRYK